MAHSFTRHGWNGSDGVGLIYSLNGGTTWQVSNYTINGVTQPLGSMGYISEVVRSPWNNNLIIAVGKTKIFRSINGGQSFELVFEKPQIINSNGVLGDGTYFTDIEFIPNSSNNVIATCARNAQTYLYHNITQEWAFVSNDSGRVNTWTHVSIPNTENAVTNGQGVITKILHSSSIQVDRTGADPNSVYLAFQINKSSSDYDIYGYKWDGSSFTQVFSDNTPTWTSQLGYSQKMSRCLISGRKGFEVSEVDVNRWYFSGDQFAMRNSIGEYHSRTRYVTRSGSNPQFSTHGDIRDIKIYGTAAGEDLMLIANDGGVAQSTNGGWSWNNINGDGLTISQFFGFDIIPGSHKAWGAAIHNGCYEMNLSSNEWRAFIDWNTDGEYVQTIRNMDGEDVAVTMVGYGGSNGFSVHSESGKYIFDWPFAEQLSVSYGPLGRRFIIHPAFQGTHNGLETRKIVGLGMELKTQEFSRQWDSDVIEVLFPRSNIGFDPKNIFDPNDDVAFTEPISIARFSEFDPNIGYLAMEMMTGNRSLHARKVFWTTSDGGQTWQNKTNFFVETTGGPLLSDWAFITDILIHPDAPGTIFITMSNYHKDPTTGLGLHRVLYSTDYGDSWTDFSENLPAVPANSLAIDGTSMLYVGTDAGVYSRDITNLQANNQWECFNLGMYDGIVEQIRIDGCDRLIYAAIRGRGLWKNNLLPTTLPNYSNITITGSPTWSGIKHINGDIIIPYSTTLTLTGKVYMSPNSQVIVEPGGKLIIDGGEITSSCSGFWGGVYIAGTSNQEQTLQHQGWLEMKNGGTISNARDGITTSNIDPISGEWISGTRGGVFKLNGAVFRNNRRDIQMLRYPYSINQKVHYNCQIDNTQFIRDESFAIETMLPSITMWDVHGVRIKGCEFSNQNQSTFKNDGGGIYAINSLFKVHESLQGVSIFEGQSEAIRSNNYCLPLMRDGEIEVRNCLFSNNIHGVYLSGTLLSSIVKNRIQVPNLAIPSIPNPPNQPAHYGIYMDMCPSFDVRQNFLKTDGINGAVTTVGIVAHNSGSNSNNIYKNELDGFTVALEAIGDNRNSSNLHGLFYQCNTIGSTNSSSVNGWTNTTSYGNEEDIFITADASLLSPSTGIAENHGFATGNYAMLPHNLFKNTTLGHQIENLSKNAHNYHFPEAVPSVDPNSVYDIVEFQHGVPGYDWLSYCVDKPDAITLSTPTLLSDITSLKTALASDISLRNQYLNGGNSPALEAQILFANTQDEYQNLYVDLMGMSPYVDEHMLMELIQIDDYPELALRNIMIANPHGARNPEIWDLLVNRIPQLSQQTLDDIQAEQQTITAFDVLQMNIALSSQNLEYSKNMLLRKYLLDYETSEASMMSFLNNEDDPTFLYMLVEEKILKNELTLANNVLNSIPNVCELTEQEQLEYNGMSTLINILINVGNERSYDELNQSEITTLENIVLNGYGLAVAKAVALLHLNGESVSYVEPIYIPSNQYSKVDAGNDQHQDRPKNITYQFRLSPNPANNVIRIDWNTSDLLGVNEMTFSLASTEGRIIMEQKIKRIEAGFLYIDISQLVPGSYIIKLSNKDASLFSEILIVE